MVLLEIRHAAAALKAQCNKTDKNDARGLAQLVLSGWFKTIHVKSEESHRVKVLLAHRRTLKRKLLDIENEVRHSMKAFGFMLGRRVQRASFMQRVRDLVAHDPLLAGVTECMLRAWLALWTEYKRLHTLLIQVAGRDELCRRYMHSRRRSGNGADGQGRHRRSEPLSQVEDRRRAFRPEAETRAVGHVGRSRRSHLAVRRRRGRDRALRGIERDADTLPEVVDAQGVGVRVAAKRGHKRAVVAVARKLAVIMHRMWRDGTEFRFSAAGQQPFDPATDEVIEASAA